MGRKINCNQRTERRKDSSHPLCLHHSISIYLLAYFVTQEGYGIRNGIYAQNLSQRIIITIFITQNLYQQTATVLARRQRPQCKNTGTILQVPKTKGDSTTSTTSSAPPAGMEGGTERRENSPTPPGKPTGMRRELQDGTRHNGFKLKEKQACS